MIWAYVEKLKRGHFLKEPFEEALKQATKEEIYEAYRALSETQKLRRMILQDELIKRIGGREQEETGLSECVYCRILIKSKVLCKKYTDVPGMEPEEIKKVVKEIVSALQRITDMAVQRRILWSAESELLRIQEHREITNVLGTAIPSPQCLH